MRLIDVDALCKKLQEELGSPEGHKKLMLINYLIMSAPTIEAEPVRRGKWSREHLPSTNGGTYEVWRCSECQKAFNWRMKYCGACGARMEDENGND